MRGGIRRSRVRAPTSARVGWRRPEVVEHEAGHVAAELLAGHEVDHGVRPAKIRLRVASLAAAWKLPKDRVTPGSASELTVSRWWSP